MRRWGTAWLCIMHRLRYKKRSSLAVCLSVCLPELSLKMSILRSTHWLELHFQRRVDNLVNQKYNHLTFTLTLQNQIRTPIPWGQFLDPRLCDGEYAREASWYWHELKLWPRLKFLKTDGTTDGGKDGAKSICTLEVVRVHTNEKEFENSWNWKT